MSVVDVDTLEADLHEESVARATAMDRYEIEDRDLLSALGSDESFVETAQAYDRVLKGRTMCCEHSERHMDAALEEIELALDVHLSRVAAAEGRDLIEEFEVFGGLR